MDLGIKESLKDNKSDLLFPEDVLKEYANHLDGETNMLIRASVNPFHGPTESYSYSPLSLSFADLLGTQKHDVQDDLGMIGNTYDSNLEFLIESPVLPDFRFRLLLVVSKMGGYPCKIVLEQGFADAINNDMGRDGYIYKIDDSDELKELLLLIFRSDKFITLVKQIAAVGERQKKLSESNAVQEQNQGE